jgi:hypothetical protein
LLLPGFGLETFADDWILPLVSLGAMVLGIVGVSEGTGALTGCRVLITVTELVDWFAEDVRTCFAGDLSLAGAFERDEHDGASLDGDWRLEKVIVLEGRDDELLMVE